MPTITTSSSVRYSVPILMIFVSNGLESTRIQIIRSQPSRVYYTTPCLYRLIRLLLSIHARCGHALFNIICTVSTRSCAVDRTHYSMRSMAKSLIERQTSAHDAPSWQRRQGGGLVPRPRVGRYSRPGMRVNWEQFDKASFNETGGVRRDAENGGRIRNVQSCAALCDRSE